MALQLTVLTGPDKDRTFTLVHGPDLMLGRSAQTQYTFTDPRVSRNHCQLEMDGDVITVICRGGGGGTFVNGKKVERHRLELGDVLQVGDTQMRLQMGDFPLAFAQQVAGQASKPAAPAAGASNVQALTALVGQTLSHYDINMVIGTGGSSVVFHATDTKDNKPVALKVLQPEFATDEEDMQRFVRGMKTTLGLCHPNIVTLHGAGKSGPYCWVAMEYVAGENLQQVIDRIGVAGMLDWRQAFRVALHVARALEHAHDRSIIHRNVTPTNILREATTKEVKLGDLMLAKALEGPLSKQLTRPGELLGDVAYMSPERTRGTTDLDARSDLYGLGATVYALLTGRPPCGGGTLIEKITRIRQTEPEKPTKFQMSIPSQFEGVVLRLLAKAPEARFPTATAVIAELERVGRFSGVPLD